MAAEWWDLSIWTLQWRTAHLTLKVKNNIPTSTSNSYYPVFFLQSVKKSKNNKLWCRWGVWLILANWLLAVSSYLDTYMSGISLTQKQSWWAYFLKCQTAPLILRSSFTAWSLFYSASVLNIWFWHIYASLEVHLSLALQDKQVLQ